MLKRIENTENKVLKTVSPELSSAGEIVYLKTKKIARTRENITFVTQFHSALPNLKNIQTGKLHLKITLIITLQRKVIKRYLNNS